MGWFYYLPWSDLCNARKTLKFSGKFSTMGQRLSEESDPDKEIDVAELQEWYKKFVVECPSGTLFMHEFKGFFGVTENKEAADYIENMFRAFDKNGVSTVYLLYYNHNFLSLKQHIRLNNFLQVKVHFVSPFNALFSLYAG